MVWQAMVKEKRERYSSLLVWAMLRKFKDGMSSLEMESVYGIPRTTINKWALCAFIDGEQR